MSRPTPETDAARHDLSDYGSPVPCSWGDWIHADVASKLERERDEARGKLAKITQAAEAVIDRWEQPAWKDTEPTGAVIYRLRDALGREAE